MPFTYVVNVYSDMSLSKGHLGSRGAKHLKINPQSVWVRRGHHDYHANSHNTLFLQDDVTFKKNHNLRDLK